MSERQCAEVGKTYEQAKRGGSHVASANECPAAMSASACGEAGETAQQTAGESHVVKPNECPAAMTDQQCAEAGRAYEEATK